MNDNKIENMFISENCKSSAFIRLFIPKTLTAAKVGIDSKKEILAASTRSKFKNLAAVIDIPDLLVPGIKDRTWNKPINIADL